MTHPHPKRNFVPRAVLTKYGLKTLNTAGQNSSRAAASVNTPRPINIAYPRPTVNCAMPASNVFNRAHSHVKRPFNKFTTDKNSNFNEKVNTVKGNVTTVGPKAVVSNNKGHEANAVKASACWVWRPEQKVLDHGNPQLELQEKGVIDSGCSRHMTGNKSYLSNYEEIDRGFVAFGGSTKGGKITGKGKIRTDTEYVVLSPDFKLLNENQVLLRVPRKNNMYSVDLKNVTAARTMLADSKLPTTFWAEAVNTACYVQNRGEKKKDAEALENEDSEVLNTEEPRVNQEKDENFNSTNNINTVSSTVNTASIEYNDVDENIVYGCADDPNMPNLEEIDYLNDDKGVGAEADMNNLDTFMPVSPIPTTRIHKDHPVEPIIGDIHLVPQTRRMTKSMTEHEPKKVFQALTDPSWIEGRMSFYSLNCSKFRRWWIYHMARGPLEQNRSTETRKMREMDVKSAFLYGKIKEEVYVCQPLGFEDPEFSDRVYKRGQIDKTLFIKRVKSDILLVQVNVDDIIFGSTTKELCTEFEKMMHKKFQMSSIGEITFFLGLQVTQKDDGIFISQDKYLDEILKKFGFSTVNTASTPIETSKPLLKDENAEDVDVHLYRSTIGSLMYLKSSRPDIIFAVCACARFQVTPKVSHLHAVKRIFRYLKGQRKLGLWYSKNSPFVLEAYTDSDYASASLDRKSITGAVFNDEYDTHTHTKKVFANMRRQEKDFSGTVTPFFPSMLASQAVEGEGSGQPSEPQHTPTTASPSYSSGPTTLVADETVHEERGDSVERAATTTASLDAEQDSENIKTTQNLEIINLKKRVKKLENKKKARTLQLKRRLFKVRIESSAKKSLGDQEDASKEGRNGIDQDEEISWFKEDVETQGRYGHDFEVNNASTSITTASINITTAEPITTANAPVTTQYKLIYRKNCHLPFEIEHHAYWALKNYNPDLIAAAVFNDEYDTPSHTKKVFAKIRRQGKDFSGTVTPLFPSMLASQAVEGEGSRQPSKPQHTPTTASPSHIVPIPTIVSSSHPKKTYKHRKTKRKTTKISLSSGPTTLVADETVHKERQDIIERAATTTTSLDAEQDSGNIIRTQSMVTLNEPIPQGTGLVNTLGSGEDSMKLNELMEIYIRLSKRVLALHNIKTARDLEIINLKKRVKKLEKKKKARTPQLKRRLIKVRIESSAEKSLGDQEDASKQGRNVIDQDEEISWFQEDAKTQGSAPVTTASVFVSTVEPSTPPTTTILIEDEDLIIAQTLMKMRSVKSKEKSKEKGVSSETTIRPTRGVIMKEASETVTRPIVPPQQQLDPKDKGKGIMQEPEKPVKVKGKDQIAFDEEVAQRFEAQMQVEYKEEERVAR
ncbi:putative ribonuclease H-like domain-containing protein [Tanacetum coccineum]